MSEATPPSPKPDDSKAPANEPANEPAEPSKDDDAWIEKVVNVAGNLGFNKTRLRWKLIRWQANRTKAANLRAQQQLHIAYAHKTCRECGAVQDKEEAVCTACGAKLGSRGLQVLGRLGILMPVGISMSTLIAIGILIAYARVWVAAGGGFSSPPVMLLLDFGGRWPPAMADEPWRLVTSVFLHAGLWHLAFNLLAIATIGPRIEELYGRTTTLGLFVVTGVLANLGALQVGRLAVGIGASGGLMGLIGVAVGYGHRAGRGRGHALRDDMLKWSAYTILFGFAVGADNWAHLFGLLAGVAFGFAVRPATWKRRMVIPARILLGAIGIVGSIGAIAIILTRTPSPIEETSDPALGPALELTEVMNGYTTVCTAFYGNDLPGAIAAAKQLAAQDVGLDGYQLDAAAIEAMCDGLQQMRVTCGTTAQMDAQAREQYEALCKLYAPVFRALPVRAPKPTAPPGGAGSGEGKP